MFPLHTAPHRRPIMGHGYFSATGTVANLLIRPFVAVVDDDESILWSLGSLLDSAEYTVRLFASAQAFLDSNCLPDIDCLISDIDMPRMDGFQLLSLVREARPRLPVILVTGYPDTLKLRPPMDATIDAVFTKPFRSPAFLAAVQKAVRAQSK